MKKHLLGVNVGAGFDLPESELIRIIASVGFDACFVARRDGEPLGDCAEQIAKSGLILQSVHGPFRRVEALWDEGDEGEE